MVGAPQAPPGTGTTLAHWGPPPKPHERWESPQHHGDGRDPPPKPRKGQGSPQLPGDRDGRDPHHPNPTRDEDHLNSMGTGMIGTPQPTGSSQATLPHAVTPQGAGLGTGGTDTVSPHQHFAIDALGQRQPLKDLAEEGKHLRCVFGLHLPLETIDLVHVVRLMVPYREVVALPGPGTPGRGQSPTAHPEIGREQGPMTQDGGQGTKSQGHVTRPHGSSPGPEIGNAAPQLGTQRQDPGQGPTTQEETADTGRGPTTRERGPGPMTQDR